MKMVEGALTHEHEQGAPRHERAQSGGHAAVNSAEMAAEIVPEIVIGDGADARTFMVTVEALILTSARAVSPQRLAQALGLMPPPAELGTDVAAMPSEVKTLTRKRRGKGAKIDEATALGRVSEAIAALNREYEQTGRSFRIEPAAGGYRVMTLPEFRAPIAALQHLGAATKLSRSAVETLAIIAYRQPVTRAHLEAIRGVACGEVLKSLVEKRLITIAGRAEELGRPLLYATSKGFLDAFGLVTLKDLPAPSELGFAVKASAGAE